MDYLENCRQKKPKMVSEMICECGKWISVHDALPKEGQLVLIYMRGIISLRMYEKHGFHHLESDYYTPLLMENGVTHWQAVYPPEPTK